MLSVKRDFQVLRRVKVSLPVDIIMALSIECELSSEEFHSNDCENVEKNALKFELKPVLKAHCYQYK